MKRIGTSIGVALMVVAVATMWGCNQEAADASAAPTSKKASFDTLVIPNGTSVVASLDTPLATDVNHSGDAFTATTNEPIVVAGRTLMPSGSKVHGVVQDLEASGRVAGRAAMTLQYQSIVDPKGQRYAISAVPLRLQAASATHSDVEKIAAGTVLGAIVGGIADGGKGAAPARAPARASGPSSCSRRRETTCRSARGRSCPSR